jgi:hypothetical protein
MSYNGADYRLCGKLMIDVANSRTRAAWINATQYPHKISSSSAVRYIRFTWPILVASIALIAVGCAQGSDQSEDTGAPASRPTPANSDARDASRIVTEHGIGRLRAGVTILADSAFRIIFEAENGRVVRYRAGRRPPVVYVERCG